MMGLAAAVAARTEVGNVVKATTFSEWAKAFFHEAMGDESVRGDGDYIVLVPGQNVKINFYEEIFKCPKWWWD